MVGHLLLYHPAVNIGSGASGELGELRFVRSDRMNFNQTRRDSVLLGSSSARPFDDELSARLRRA